MVTTLRAESHALTAWIRHGTFDPSNRFGLTQNGEHLTFRAMQSEDSSAVGSEFYHGFFETLGLLNPVYRSATIIETESGSPLSVPTLDDSESATIVDENADNTGGTDIEFDNVDLGAYKYSSKTLRLSNELLTDAIPALMGQAGKTLGKRIARQSNLDFTIGDGDAKPFGIVTQSQLGHSAPSDSAITYADLLELQHSVDPAYWSRASFMMSAETFKSVRQLRDADGNPAYQRGLLLDRPVALNSAMPAIAAESKALIFGDFSNYLIRVSGSLQLRRYTEKYADYGQTGVAAVLRLDGALAVPSSVKHLAMAS